MSDCLSLSFILICCCFHELHFLSDLINKHIKYLFVCVVEVQCTVHHLTMSINSIYEVAYKGDFNQIKVKVDENVSLVKTTDENGRLLLHWAAIGGNENLVDFLIDNGSAINSIDDTNSSALTLAASAGRLPVVKLLIDRGADVNHQNNRGQSSLHYACSKGHFEIAKLLIEAGANVNKTDNLKATPLHRAAAQGRSNIVELLLQSPALEIDAQDCTGSSPL
ncbi:hypothetical protein ABMA27_014699 [Loxostege sticticalis]|uniref:26S proteasome non-ATPase regulatory subunit 10 n=1 Tax=Loxostege sticticalis TaxID=481309 RepID=A0ABR3I9U7_LOXSC